VGDTVRYKIEGTEKMKLKLTAIGKLYPNIAKAALRKEAEDIMREAKLITPVDTGTLRSSGHVKQDHGHEIAVTLGFGGAAAPYAVFVHENLMSRHKPPTRAKFLEMPLRKAMIGMVGRLARSMRIMLGQRL
jgi:hypothetical protein